MPDSSGGTLDLEISAANTVCSNLAGGARGNGGPALRVKLPSRILKFGFLTLDWGGHAMKLGIISDSHDRSEWVEVALAEFRRQGAHRLIHCGDITSPKTIALFAGWDVDFVLGNCDWDPVALESAMSRIGARLHKPFGELDLDGRSVAWLHSDDARLFHSLEHADHYDYLFYGHSHVAEQHRTGRTLVVNAGALHRVRDRTVAVLDCATGEVEPITLKG